MVRALVAGIDLPADPMLAPVWPELDALELRSMLEAGVCPDCALGPFAAIGSHMVGKHGIDLQAVRDQALLPKYYGLVSPEYRRRRQEIALRLWDERDEPLVALTRTRRMSRYGVAVNRAKSATNRRELGRRGTAEQMRVASQIRVRKLKAVEDAVAPLLRQMADAGSTAREIAPVVGLHERTVRLRLRAMGYDLIANRSASPSWRSASVTNLDQGRRTHMANAEADRATLAAEFVELGSDWAALAALAAGHGRSMKQTKARLGRAGVTVPDGRAVSPRRLGHVRTPPAAVRCCSVEGCARRYRCRGFCSMHYQRWRKAARPVPAR